MSYFYGTNVTTHTHKHTPMHHNSYRGIHTHVSSSWFHRFSQIFDAECVWCGSAAEYSKTRISSEYSKTEAIESIFEQKMKTISCRLKSELILFYTVNKGEKQKKKTHTHLTTTIRAWFLDQTWKYCDRKWRLSVHRY